MEGAVYSLVPGELVAKVWSRRGIDSLRRLEAFYERLASTNGRLRTPQILDVDIVDGVAVSKEMFLPGVPLERHLTQTAKRADLRAVDATVEVLQFLRGVGEADEFRDVLVLDETQSAWKSTACWSDAIGQLLHRRLARFGDQLEPVVPHLDEVLEGTLAFLRTRDDAEMSVIHGDLCPANVMVDDTLDPVAVLDFGFLSTVGDPAFDASIASAIFNMYGPNTRVIDEQVVLAMEEVGYGGEVLLAYRAVYALLTSNAYALDGDDGHFRWCVEMLGRRDVRGALGI